MRIAFAAAGNDEPSAGFQTRCRAAQKCLVIVHPMQRGVGKNQIELVVESDFARVHDVKCEIGNFSSRERFSCANAIISGEASTPGDRAARQSPGDFRRHLAVAAADIENVFVAAQFESGDQFARPGLLHDGIRGVIRRVPFCRLNEAVSQASTQTNPAVSGKPHKMFMLCTAWPLAPLTRLSSALITMSRPVRGSSRHAISMTFVPTTFFVSGSALPSSSRTNGSLP